MSRRLRLLLGAAALLMALLVLGARLLDREALPAAAEALEASGPGEALALLQPDAPLPPSADRLYTLGVLHHRAGDLPRAVAAWRHARLLAPRDPDLVHNLARARAELADEVSPIPPPAPAPHGWMEIASPVEVGVLALGAWLALTIGAWRWLRAGRPRDRTWLAPGATGLALALLLGLLFAQGRRALVDQPPAVTVQAAALRDGASLDAGVRLELPPGTEVRALARRGPFVLVEDGTPRRGWVLRDALAIPGRLP